MGKDNYFVKSVNATLSILIAVSLFLSNVDTLPESFQNSSRLIYILLIIILSLHYGLKNNVKYKIYHFPLLMYVIFYFISALLSIDVMHGLKIFMLHSMLFVFFILSWSNVDKDIIRSHLNILTYVTLIICGFTNILILIFGYSIFSGLFVYSFDFYEYEGRIGWIGIFNNANTLAIILTTALYWLTYIAKVSPSVFKYILLTISLASLLGTLSRSALLAYCIFLIIYLIRVRHILFYFSIIAILGIGIQVNDVNFDEVRLIERILTGGLTGRSEIWTDALSIISEKPFFGLGPNQYNYYGYSAHNYYLNLAANLGIFALISFLATILMFAFNLIFRIFRGKNNDSCKFGLAIIAAVMIQQIFESGGFELTRFQGLMFFLMLLSILNEEIINKNKIKK